MYDTTAYTTTDLILMLTWSGVLPTIILVGLYIVFSGIQEVWHWMLDRA